MKSALNTNNHKWSSSYGGNAWRKKPRVVVHVEGDRVVVTAITTTLSIETEQGGIEGFGCMLILGEIMKADI